MLYLLPNVASCKLLGKLTVILSFVQFPWITAMEYNWGKFVSAVLYTVKVNLTILSPELSRSIIYYHCLLYCVLS